MFTSISFSIFGNHRLIKGQGNAGTFDFTVNVANKGLAQMNAATQYTFQLRADDFTPSQAGTGGQF